jgi:hypothetical protein
MVPLEVASSARGDDTGRLALAVGVPGASAASTLKSLHITQPSSQSGVDGSRSERLGCGLLKPGRYQRHRMPNDIL